MKTLLVVLAVAALAAPALGYGVFFSASGDGSFDTFRSSGGEGYSNGGGAGIVRLEKSNQAMGWISFSGATDGFGTSLTSYLASSPSHAGYLYVRSANVRLGAAGAYMVSMRTGNQGSLVEDQGNGNGYGPGNPDPGYAGASELQAFRGCAPDASGTFPNFGDGIYTGEVATSGGGVPWITPSTRAADIGWSPFKWGANQMVQYDKGIWQNGSATGKYLGYFADTPTGGGRNYYALEDVLGLGNHNSRAASWTDIANAGQIVNHGFDVSPLLVNNAFYVADDPRTHTDGWLAIPLDAAFLMDLLNPENKGFVFSNSIAGQEQDLSNADFYTKDYQGGIYAPYLLLDVPEPATMILLAMGGVAVLRRRRA